MNSEFYLPKYTNSWALIIGINNYQHTNPLDYAINDAKAVANILTTKFNFPKENVKLLLDDEASKSTILDSFLQYSGELVQANDRILFFFAGHGYTYPSKRGEVGFLMPVDGTTDNLATLIRWDELTRNAELISAKHVLFVMDACYGGLALTRALSPGSMRFLKDMLQRYARQVLTAGKADELVLDSGGPLASHSMFTGHFLQGLEGKAASSDGTLTANGVMAYIYEKVSKDSKSFQTPHFGFLDGGGDFIFDAPILESISGLVKIDKDVLVEVPYPSNTDLANKIDTQFIDTIKEYLADDKYRIKLHDLALQNIKKFKSLMMDEKLLVQVNLLKSKDIIERLRHYETIVRDLEILLSYWGNGIHRPILSKIITRMSEWPRILLANLLRGVVREERYNQAAKTGE